MDLFKALVFLSIAVLLATIGINADHIEQRKQKTEAVVRMTTKFSVSYCIMNIT